MLPIPSAMRNDPLDALMDRGAVLLDQPAAAGDIEDAPGGLLLVGAEATLGVIFRVFGGAYLEQYGEQPQKPCHAPLFFRCRSPIGSSHVRVSRLRPPNRPPV